MRAAGDGGFAARAALRLIRPMAAPGIRKLLRTRRRRFFLLAQQHGLWRRAAEPIGREPNGRVSVEEADGLLTSLERDLLALVNTQNRPPGHPAVHRGPSAGIGATTADTMPDLLSSTGTPRRRSNRYARPRSGWSKCPTIIGAPAIIARGLMLAWAPASPAGRPARHGDGRYRGQHAGALRRGCERARWPPGELAGRCARARA